MPKLTTRIDDEDDARLRFWARERGYNVSEYVALAVKEKMEREAKKLDAIGLTNIFDDLGETQAKTAAWWLRLFRKYGVTI